MNKLLILCGLAVLSTTFTPEKSKTPSECEPLTLKANFQNVNPVILAMDQEDIWDAPQWTDPSKTADKTEIDLKNIPFLEEEDEVDLGFDTALYLPEGFDPHNS
jgi:hypothetical protein